VAVERPQPIPFRKAMTMAAEAPAAPPMPAGASAQSVGSLHFYTIARPTSLANGESKQLMLLQIANLPVKRDYTVRGQPYFYTTAMPGQSQTGGAEVEVTIKNESGPAPKSDGKGKRERELKDALNGALGVSLPAGTVRAYGDDDDGAAQFLGEDHADAVAPGGEMKLHFGRDADIPVVRDQVSFARATDTITISAWRISVKNTKLKPVTVRIVEPVPGNWEIVKESQPHAKNDAGLPEWDVPLAPKGEVVLEYSVKTTM
jgi:hypothetical protein